MNKIRITIFIVVLSVAHSASAEETGWFSASETRIATKQTLPLLDQASAMKFALVSDYPSDNAGLIRLQRSLKTSEFQFTPQQNTWVVLAVLAVIVIVIVVATVGFGGS